MLPLYNSVSLTEVIGILIPWLDEVIYPGSPLLRQIASYHLRRLGGSLCPRSIKGFVGDSLLKGYGEKDIKATLQLAIAEAYIEYDWGISTTKLSNWLSWRIPYIASKYLRPHFGEIIVDGSYEIDLPDMERFIVESTCDFLSLERQKKKYYIDKISKE